MATQLAKPIVNNYGPYALYMRIRKVKEEEGCDIGRALDIVHAEILENPYELKMWWKYSGRSMMAQLERIFSAMSRPVVVPQERRSTKIRPNYLEKYRTGEITIFDTEIAIGNRGLRKRLGDVTREEAEECASYLRTISRTIERRAMAFDEIASQMKAGETIEEAVKRLKLDARDVAKRLL